MMSIAEELKQKTLAYWKLSQIWNGKREVNIGVEDALKICGTIMIMTSNTRPLSFYTDALREELIQGQGKKKPVSEVIPFKRNEVGASA